MTGSLLSVALSKAIFSYLLMAVIAMLTAVFIHFLVKGLAMFDERTRRDSAPPPPPAPPKAPPAAKKVAGEIEPSIIAAIAAAVHAMIGAHRIVYIGETSPAGGWMTETRVRHHSHEPQVHHEA